MFVNLANNQRSSRTKHAATIHTWHKIMFGLQFDLGHLDHFGLQPVDLFPRRGFTKDFQFVQNVPPPMPFKAVKSVNLPAAGVVKPMVELLITALSIVTFEIEPPVITM